MQLQALRFWQSALNLSCAAQTSQPWHPLYRSGGHFPCRYGPPGTTAAKAARWRVAHQPRPDGPYPTDRSRRIRPATRKPNRRFDRPPVRHAFGRRIMLAFFMATPLRNTGPTSPEAAPLFSVSRSALSVFAVLTGNFVTPESRADPAMRCLYDLVIRWRQSATARSRFASAGSSPLGVRRRSQQTTWDRRPRLQAAS